MSDLHSLWDTLLIAKGLRTVPRNYSHPLPFPEIEYALRGTIYDSYVRRIMYEGIMGKWRDEIQSWLTCPAPSPPNGQSQQVMMTVAQDHLRRTEETDDDILCPYHWAQPIHALNCELVWPKALDQPPYGSNTRLSLSSFLRDSPDLDSDGTDAAKDPPHPYLELDTPEYSGVISDRWILEKLLAMAGVRLAALLNYLFAEDGSAGLRVFGDF
jgi:hypothetical protein